MTSWRDSQRRGQTSTIRSHLTVVAGLLGLALVGAVLSTLFRPVADPPPVSAAPPVEARSPVEPAPVPTYDPELVARVERILERGRVSLGHVIVMDPRDGRLLAAVSTDTERFPPDRTYPAASLIKVVTAAAALHQDPGVARRSCRYTGSPWRLTRSRIDPPRRGNESSFRKALAISNNQCFAQLAVHTVGADVLIDAIGRFGFLESPAPGFPAGRVDAGTDRYALGRLGSGLSGTWITPLHAVQMAAVLHDGMLRQPVTLAGAVPSHPPRRVLTAELAGELREMLVDTTRRGTARSAFRDRRGRPLLGPVRVAGKTGSLSGRDPDGRYEWFAGIAPADAPEIAVAVVLVQGDLWWRNASQIAAATLKAHFCPDRTCR
ncbi:MAG: hypothetical protein JRF70_08845 [Deltaproteobacteria bacterium]|nr:hypothetical protein [Deltaproteobacteria bacterium]